MQQSMGAFLYIVSVYYIDIRLTLKMQHAMHTTVNIVCPKKAQNVYIHRNSSLSINIEQKLSVGSCLMIFCITCI